MGGRGATFGGVHVQTLLIDVLDVDVALVLELLVEVDVEVQMILVDL